MSIGASRPAFRAVSKKAVKSGTRSSVQSAATQAPRKRRSTGEVRLLILKTAADLFVKRGYDRTSTREIAEAAGIVEPMIFRHFGTKENLFEHAVFLPFAEFVDGYIQRRRELDSAGLSPAELGNMFVTSLYGLLHQHRGLIRELLIVGFRSDWRLIHTGAPDSPFGQLFRQLDEIGAHQMKTGRQRGSDARLMTRITFGTVLSMAILGEWMFPEKKSRPSEAQLIDELSKFLLHAISATPPEATASPVQTARKAAHKEPVKTPARLRK